MLIKSVEIREFSKKNKENENVSPAFLQISIIFYTKLMFVIEFCRDGYASMNFYGWKKEKTFK
jgi:hypothetical protein